MKSKTIRLFSQNPQLVQLVRDHVQAANFELELAGETTVSATASPALQIVEIAAAKLTGTVSTSIKSAISSQHPILAICTEAPTAWHYEQAMLLGAKQLRQLPADSKLFLQDLLQLHPHRQQAIPLLTVSGSSAAGSTWLALALAGAANRNGIKTALVDLDPHGAGILEIADLQYLPGARWQDFSQVPPSATNIENANAILQALPQLERLHLLGFSAGNERRVPSAAKSLISNLASATELLILDIPITSPLLPAFNESKMLFTVLADQFGVQSAQVRIAQLKRLVPGARIELAIRQPQGSRLFKGQEIAEILALPLALEFTSYRGNIIPLQDLRLHFQHRKGLDAACTAFIKNHEWGAVNANT